MTRVFICLQTGKILKGLVSDVAVFTRLRYFSLYLLTGDVNYSSPPPCETLGGLLGVSVPPA